jgi:hypothetical protein
MNLHSPTFRRVRFCILAILVAIPALLLWNLVDNYRFVTPQYDDLAFTEFYLDVQESESFPWDEALKSHNEHRVIFTRLGSMVITKLTGGDIDVFSKLTFFFMVFVAGGLIYLGRGVWKEAGALGWVALFVITLLLFTPVASYAWQWGFIFGNLVPWVSLVAGLLLLHSRMSFAALIPLLSLFAVCSTFSFGMGLLLFILFPLHAWLIGRLPSGKGRWISLGFWMGIAVLTISYAMGGIGDRLSETHEKAKGLTLVIQEPLLAVEFFFAVLGLPLGKGTVIPFAALAGCVGFVVFVVWLTSATTVVLRWRKQDASSRRDVAVWLTLGMAAIGSAGLITIGRLTRSGVLAESEHYVVTVVYGLVSAVALLLYYRAFFQRWIVVSLYACVILLSVINWNLGVQRMKWWLTQSYQRKVSVEFMDVFARADFPLLNDLPSAWDITKRMLPEGLAGDVKMAPGTDLSDYRILSPLKQHRGRFIDIHDGVARGFAQLYVGNEGLKRPADAVLFAWRPLDDTAEKWTLFDIAFPKPPRTYYRSPQEVKDDPEHFNSWEKKLSVERIKQASVRIRAYAFDGLSRRLRPIPGDFDLIDGEFTRVSVQ